MNLYLYGSIFLIIVILGWYFFRPGPKWIGKWKQKNSDNFMQINKNKTFKSHGIQGTYQIIDENTFVIFFDSQSFKIVYDPKTDTLIMDMGGRSSGPGGPVTPPVFVRA